MITDNEKAATFIGWTLGRQYTTDLWVPDMSKPENYMRADVRWLIDTQADNWTAWRSGKVGHGASPVPALAALYDAEHGKKD